MHVLQVVGARPNFMKVAPVMAAFEPHGVRQTLVHTGQHYDQKMSDIFFKQLDIPLPDVSLGIGSGSHAVQTARVMERFEEVVLEKSPDLVCVYGDINSTAAAALVCAKLRIPVAHVEAGLRSFDREMPEETNRVITDHISDWLFTPSEDGDANLLREGINSSRIVRIGNVMIDTLMRLLPRAEMPTIDGLAEQYILVTLHRPSNVDQPEQLANILTALDEISQQAQIVFPVHPRTRARMADAGFESSSRILLTEPCGYLNFLALQKHAQAVITDSGGIQEETTVLNVPCLTVRENTERPITVEVGTNIVVGNDFDRLQKEVNSALTGDFKAGHIPPLWDGRAAERLAAFVVANVATESEACQLVA